jgi:23S rRNA pseudouridine955/2504/2580 synthase
LYPDLPLSVVYRMFRTGSIRLSGRKSKGSELVQSGDEIMVHRPAGSGSVLRDRGVQAPANPDLVRRSTEFLESILLEQTPDLMIINKPKGLLTHGPAGLDEIIAAYHAGTPQSSLSFRPAPLHRLDRNTSGALAVSASINGARTFSAALRDGRIGKEYLALLDGRLEAAIVLKDRLSRDGENRTSTVIRDGDGPIADTRLVPICANAEYTLAAVRITTGLTHQIRVQCASHGHPLAGDGKYGGSPLKGSYLLHCAFLEFPADLGAANPGTCAAPLPPAFRAVIRGIFDPVSLDSEAFRRYP